MFFAFLLQKRERRAELRMQALGAVAHHRQATAFFWAVLGKRRDDDMPTGLDGTQDCLDVSLSLL